jgi:hypothetical protein
VPLINCRAGTVENLPAEAGRALPIPALQKGIRHLICEMLKAAKLTRKKRRIGHVKRTRSEERDQKETIQNPKRKETG